MCVGMKSMLLTAGKFGSDKLGQDQLLGTRSNWSNLSCFKPNVSTETSFLFYFLWTDADAELKPKILKDPFNLHDLRSTTRIHRKAVNECLHLLPVETRANHELQETATPRALKKYRPRLSQNIETVGN